MQITRPSVTVVVVLCLVAGLALCWLAGSIMVRGETSLVPPARPPARDFVLHTPDGVALTATYWPGKQQNGPAVLLLHGVGSSRAATADNAAWLAHQGYAALTIDFRGHGGSSLRQRSFGWNEAVDARTAFDWLKRQQRSAPVAVIGISMGGAASLLGRSGPLPADALVLQAVYPDIRHAIRDRIASRLTWAPAVVLEPLLSLQSLPRFGVWPSSLAPLSGVGRYPGPVLMIGGGEDRYTPPSETRALFAAASGGKELWIVPGRDHAATCALDSVEYRQRVSNFLRRTIGAP